MIVKWCRVPEGVFSHICVAEIVVIVQIAPVSSNQNNKDPLPALAVRDLPRSSCRTLGCAYRSMVRTHRIVLWCGKLGRTRAEIDNDISLA